MKKTTYIWKNGELIKWEDATTHVLTHALHYGSAMFEGVRAYSTDKGPAIFRSDEHYQRLVDSCKIYNMPVPYTKEELIQGTKDLIKANNLESCYIRPLVYRGYGEMGLSPHKCPVDVIIAAWEWGSYLGEEGLEKGIRCKVSSWSRIHSRSLPPLAKCTANYANSILARQEAADCGYDEAILLSIHGNVSEGPGENIFMIKNGKIYTPPLSDDALSGITAKSLMQLATDLGYEISYFSMMRDELLTADELFFTGTAAEVTPIREIDGRVIGSGKRGPITAKLQQLFFEIVKGKSSAHPEWLDYVN